MTTPANPVVAAFVDAVNAHDREAFSAVLTPDATMSDDGTDRDLQAWADQEIFGADARMAVTQQSGDGLILQADYTNSTWGTMRTRWSFILSGDKISRFETGQA